MYDFHRDDAFVTVLKSLSIITMPINIITCYCIVFKSPQQMKNYRWLLLINQLLTGFTDIYISYLALPIQFVPVAMGYTRGLISEYMPSISTHAQAVICFVVLAESLFVILTMFVFRHQASQFPSSRFKIKQRESCLGVVFYHILLAFMVLCFATTKHNTPELKQHILETFTWLPPGALDIPSLTVYDIDDPVIMLVVACGMTVLFGASTSISLLIWHTLHSLKRNKTLSRNSTKQHKYMLLCLIIQAAAPVMAVTTPVFAALLLISLKVNLRPNLMQVIVIGLAVHGSFGGFLLVVLTKPYRTFIFGVFMPNKTTTNVMDIERTSNGLRRQAYSIKNISTI